MNIYVKEGFDQELLISIYRFICGHYMKSIQINIPISNLYDV